MLSKFLIDSELFLAPSLLESAVKLEGGKEADHGGRDLCEHGILLFAEGTGGVLHEPVADAVRARQLVSTLLTLHRLFIRCQKLVADAAP